jgi:hypothetical protein
MVKKPKDLVEEAKAYVDALPDETAEGRLVTDKGTPADAAAWQKDQDKQKEAFRPKPM